MCLQPLASTVSTSKDDNAEHVVTLLPFEKSIPLMTETFSTSTLTWYKLENGQTLEQVATLMRERVVQILQANPWLGGRIKTKNFQPAIVYTPVVSKNQADTILTVYTDIPVSMETPYREASALLQRTVVPNTFPWVWQRDVPFFRVALVQDCSNPERFALVSSLAHCVGDGKTYYNLHNMLADKAPIVPLRIERKHHLQEVMTKAMGGKSYMEVYYKVSIGFAIRVVRSVLMALLFGPSHSVKLYTINEDWTKEEKKLALENHDNNSSIPRPPFLSSSDVMTSQFLKSVGCDQGLVCVNYRGKIPDCHEHDAGNYYNFNALRWADFSTPVGIRTVVNQLKLGQRYPTTRPMTAMEHMFSFGKPLAYFTNLADFARPMPLVNCKELVHMPLVPSHSFRLPPSFMSFCYVFRPHTEGNKLAILMSTTPKTMKELESSGMMGPELMKPGTVEM